MTRDEHLTRTLRYAVAALLVMAAYGAAQTLHLGETADWLIVAFMGACAWAARRECQRLDRARAEAEEDRRLTRPLPQVDPGEIFAEERSADAHLRAILRDMPRSLTEANRRLTEAREPWRVVYRPGDPVDDYMTPEGADRLLRAMRESECADCGEDHDDEGDPGPVEMSARAAVDALPYRDLLDRWDAELVALRSSWAA